MALRPNQVATSQGPVLTTYLHSSTFIHVELTEKQLFPAEFSWDVTLYDSISNVKLKLLFDLCLDRLIGLLTCSPSPFLLSLAQVKMKSNTAQAD